MGSEWPQVSLREFADLLAGFAFKSSGYTEESGDIRLLRGDNIAPGKVRWDGVKRWTRDGLAELSRYSLEAGDVVLAMDRPWIPAGLKVAQVSAADTPSYLVQRVARLRTSSLEDQGFLFALLSTPDFESYIQSATTGTAVPHISAKQILNFSFRLPPSHVRAQIGALTSALDDRITLLRETNATLEAIAQALFKSWFVDFDPVRANIAAKSAPEGAAQGSTSTAQGTTAGMPEAGQRRKPLPPMPAAALDAATAALFPDSFEESELGLVPQGWRVGKVEDLMELAYGKALKATDRNDGPVPVYGSGGITGYHDQALVAGPSIIVGRKGTVGSLYWEDQPFFPIDTVFYVKTDRPLTYCYYLLQTLGLEDMNTDGAVPGLNRGNAYRLPVVIPDKSVLNAFNETTTALRDMMFANKQQAQTLTQLRDTLLPRLIAGTLRLPEAC